MGVGDSPSLVLLESCGQVKALVNAESEMETATPSASELGRD